MNALAAPLPLPRPRRLVIADDCPDTRRMIREALADSFSDVLESTDGRSLFWTLEAAFRAVNDAGPELLVIADERMPVYSGLHALEAWSDLERALPFIVLSSSPDHGIRERVQAMGALLLRKPFSPRKLCRMVSQLL